MQYELPHCLVSLLFFFPQRKHKIWRNPFFPLWTLDFYHSHHLQESSGRNTIQKDRKKLKKKNKSHTSSLWYFYQSLSLRWSRTGLKILSSTPFPAVASANFPWLLPTNSNSKQPLATTASKLTKLILILNNIYKNNNALF